MRSVNSAFRSRLQQDAGQLAELIDLDTPSASFHWTTANHQMTWTRSGVATQYDPFPGNTARGILESADLAVAVVDFVMANTGDIFRAITAGGDFSLSALRIGRVFVDTPDLDRMSIYDGQIGEYSYDRTAIVGQARNTWKSVSVQWPHYTYQDKCSWRFGSAGCGFNVSSVTLVVPSNSVNILSTSSISIHFEAGTLINSYSNGRFNGGRVTITSGINSGQVRAIRSHSGDLLILSHPLPVNSFSGMGVSIYPGCKKRLIEDCTSLYNNQVNFLGWPWIPIQETAVI